MEVEIYHKKRDGWARITELRIGERIIETPAVISCKDPLMDEINFNLVPYSLKSFDVNRFKVLHTEDPNFIAGTGLAPLSPSEQVKCLKELRGKSLIKPLILTGIATPQNLLILCYYGVDLVDDSRAIIAAHKGIYLLENGFFQIEKLKELPCSCPVCEKIRENYQNLEFEEKVRFLREHNVLKLQEQALLVKELIRTECLRNFVEARAKTSPDLTVMLRKEGRFFERIHPKFKRSVVYMNTIESFKRPEVSYFLEKLPEVYRPRTKVAILLPCTARKPYSLSKTHRRILGRIGKLVNFVDEIVISSPLVCPREFELTYPAQNYDTPVTGVWSDEEVDFVANNLVRLLGSFEKVIAHVEGGYRKVIERIEGMADFSVVYTAENGVTSEESLRNLRKEIEKSAEKEKDRFMALFESMFRYQFGVGLDEVVGKARVKGRYPKLELYSRGRVLRVDSIYGMLDVDLSLAEKLIELKINLVEIGEFEPRGTIFSAGILKADTAIRPNDIVFFRNSEYFGVGRALMSGEEMVEASKGVAVEVKRKRAY